MKKINKMLDEVNRITVQHYQLKRTMGGGLQLIDPGMIAVVGGPYGMAPGEFEGHLKSFLRGLRAGRVKS